jgi:hypothetical protein
MNRKRTEAESGKTADIIYVSSFFSLTLFFFGPGHLYFHNILEYSFAFSEISLNLILTTCLSFSLLSAILLPFSKSSNHERAVSVFFTLSFLLWLQGNILLWDYGLLDGSDIDWDEKSVYGFIECTLWTLFLLFALLKPSAIYKIVRKGSMIFILIQLVSLSILFTQTSKPSWLKYTINKDSQFNFSPEKNIIILVLDTFQTDIFQEIIGEDKYYRDIFEGFTYFRNAVGGFPRTYPSVPLMLTGQFYDNSIPVQDFLKKAYLSNSIPQMLKKNGFHVYLPLKPYIYFDNNITSTLERKSSFTILDYGKTAPLLDVSFFRYSPHYIKKLLFERIQYKKPVLGMGAKAHEDVRFLEDMIAEAKAESAKSAFKFYHLSVPHPPLVLNERLEYEKIELNREGVKRQSKAALEITKRFLKTLKDLGIYDSSMVFVVADHGADIPERPSETSQNNMGYVNPLILVKPFHSGGTLKVSDAPVSLSDMPMTIFTELGLQIDVPGLSMFRVNDSHGRKRRYLSYHWTRDDSKLHYLPTMREYHVIGHSWQLGSWQRTNRTFTVQGVRISEATNSLRHSYSFGEEVRFGSRGNSERYQGYGWAHGARGNVTLTTGEKAALTFELDPTPKGIVILKARLIPLLVKGKPEKQRVVVKVNGNVEGIWPVEKAGEYTTIIPERHVAGARQLDIVFELPDAKSSVDLGTDNESRRFGIGMRSIVLNSY